MALSKKETKKIADLARLKLKEEELAKFADQLSGVLDNFKMLSEVNTKNTKPTSQVTGLNNICREDKKILDWKANKDIKKNREKLLMNAPKQEDGFIKVPGVFEE
ncbi:Asp-tRNA(Asn)/Glu-tRNA(Gln) amidotransferase subunit GatC [Patescibacteria group bacterium]|nr:Asp-tRNA(Asn)/Glu-tRNA(Gln) amidotransferase subunit GatC [Patescibacteria group bacterium]